MFFVGEPSAASQQQPDKQYWDDIASVAREAANSEEPLVYAGLRLLQRSGCATPSSRPSKPHANPEKVSAAHALEIRRAEDELQELLSQLERVEAAEARQAAHVIAMAGQRSEAQAARIIQAAFHGMIGRAWCVKLCIERREQSAVLIQAAFHGYYARSQARASRRDAVEQQVAAITIQAARHGQQARSFAREVRHTIDGPAAAVEDVWATRI